jgi:hypothetical protein
VFKKEKQQPSEEDKAKKREKYLNSKKPNRFETPILFFIILERFRIATA